MREEEKAGDWFLIFWSVRRRRRWCEEEKGRSEAVCWQAIVDVGDVAREKI